MDANLIKDVAIKTKIKERQIEEVLKMLDEGNTIPFIARYRKEVTGGLDESKFKQFIKSGVIVLTYKKEKKRY